MAKSLQTTFIASSVLLHMLCCYPKQLHSAAGNFCTPVLPPSIPDCHVGSISVAESRLLERYVKLNMTAAQTSLVEIINISACHPDFLSLNQSQRMLGINPAVARDDSPALGKAVTYLRQCFLPIMHRMEDSEMRHHMDGEQIHLDTQLRAVKEHIASAVASLTELTRGDPRLTIGGECSIPNVQCVRLRPINGTEGQIRFSELWTIGKSTHLYLADLYGMNYWDINNVN